MPEWKNVLAILFDYFELLLVVGVESLQQAEVKRVTRLILVHLQGLVYFADCHGPHNWVFVGKVLYQGHVITISIGVVRITIQDMCLLKLYQCALTGSQHTVEQHFEEAHRSKDVDHI